MTVLKLTLNFNKAINLDRRHNSCSTTSTTVSFVSSWMRHVTKNTSSLLNISVSSVQAITWKRHFGINKAFSISSVFAGQECCVRVEGRPRKGEGGCVFKFIRIIISIYKAKITHVHNLSVLFHLNFFSFILCVRQTHSFFLSPHLRIIIRSSKLYINTNGTMGTMLFFKKSKINQNNVVF